MLDFNETGCIPSYPALCLQLAQCLRWYVGYLTDFEDEEGKGRFSDEIARCEQLRKDIEEFCLEKGAPPKYFRIVSWYGFAVIDGDLAPPRPPWAK